MISVNKRWQTFDAHVLKALYVYLALGECANKTEEPETNKWQHRFCVAQCTQSTGYSLAFCKYLLKYTEFSKLQMFYSIQCMALHDKRSKMVLGISILATKITRSMSSHQMKFFFSTSTVELQQPNCNWSCGYWKIMNTDRKQIPNYLKQIDDICSRI